MATVKKVAAAKKPTKKATTKNLAAKKTTPEAVEVVTLTITDLIVEEGFNVRENYGDIEALAASIKENGIKQPLKVRKMTDGYGIIDGHRRYEAVKLLIAKSELDSPETFPFPVIIESEEDASDIQRLLSLLIYNDGKPLTILEEAIVFQRLQIAGVEAKEAAKMAGKSVTHVYDCNLLMTAPEALLDKIRKGEVAATLVIEQLKKADGDGEKVVDDIEDAQKKSGKKKVTRKHMEGEESKPKTISVTVDNLNHILESLRDVDFGPFVVRESRFTVLETLIAFIKDEVEFEELAMTFGDRDGVRPEGDLNPDEA